MSDVMGNNGQGELVPVRQEGTPDDAHSSSSSNVCPCGECDVRTMVCPMCDQIVFECEFETDRAMYDAVAKVVLKYYEWQGCCSTCVFNYPHWENMAEGIVDENET